MPRELSEILQWMNGSHGAAAIAIAIFLGTFVSEDAATLSAAALVQLGRIDPLLGLISCFAGIWVGDIGIFAAARRLENRARVELYSPSDCKPRRRHKPG